jgi:hypothetical protein
MGVRGTLSPNVPAAREKDDRGGGKKSSPCEARQVEPCLPLCRAFPFFLSPPSSLLAFAPPLAYAVLTPRLRPAYAEMLLLIFCSGQSEISLSLSLSLSLFLSLSLSLLHLTCTHTSQQAPHNMQLQGPGSSGPKLKFALTPGKGTLSKRPTTLPAVGAALGSLGKAGNGLGARQNSRAGDFTALARAGKAGAAGVNPTQPGNRRARIGAAGRRRRPRPRGPC